MPRRWCVDTFGVLYCFQACFPRGCGIQRIPGDGRERSKKTKQKVYSPAGVLVWGSSLSKGRVLSYVLYGIPGFIYTYALFKPLSTRIFSCDVPGLAWSPTINSQNQRWGPKTPKPCIPLCSNTIFGSDCCICSPGILVVFARFVRIIQLLAIFNFWFRDFWISN